MRRGEKTKTPEELRDPGVLRGGFGALLPRRCPFRARARLPYAARDGVAPATRMLQASRAALVAELVKAALVRYQSAPPLFPPPIYANGGFSCFCFVVGPAKPSAVFVFFGPAATPFCFSPGGFSLGLWTVARVPAVNPLLGARPAFSHLWRLPRRVAKATSCTCCRLRRLLRCCRAN